MSAAPARWLAITLDLDGPSEYAALHGVTSAGEPHVMYGAPLDRFTTLCRSLGAAATLFAVGRDVIGVAAEKLAALSAAGCEVANHSWAHDYRLSRCGAAQIADDLGRAQQAITRAVGKAPLGFRAPGHHLSPALLEVLQGAGLRYDSSVLPSPPYYMAKALVLAAYRLTGRRSAAMLGGPAIAFAPRQPYRPGRTPYGVGARPLVELPISVVTPLGLPLIGAPLLLAPGWLRALMLRSASRSPGVVIDLHAMDLADAAELPPAIAARQRELRIPVATRARMIGDVLTTLAAGRRLVTCAEVVQEIMTRQS